VEGVRYYHIYLAANKFSIVTDHKMLTYLQQMRLSGNSRLSRWALALQPYKYTVTYKKVLSSQQQIQYLDWKMHQDRRKMNTR
jgi:RNase H-like domain found in reverse transcriptase